MLNELQEDFPQSKPNMIYNLMKKLDFTKSLVKAQLKFYTS